MVKYPRTMSRDTKPKCLGPDGEWIQGRDLAVATWDEAKPLPHPGFRVGQVWAWMSVGRVYSMQITVSRDGFFGALYWNHDGVPFPERWSTGQLHRMFDHLSGFLVADPACPQLAPWAPVKGSTHVHWIDEEEASP